MAVNLMPKPFRYTIDNDGVETELTTDPKGWDGHEVGFERSEDFGLSIQNVVPLSFSGAGRTILKGVYESKGIFGRTRTLIEKRQNDWSYAPFYTYKHDYSTYKDNLRYVEIAGIEDGLAKKFDTYKDTEYEIDLPTSGKVFIDYSGAKYTTTNQIQAGAGSIQGFQKPDIVAGNDAYALRGTRAVRAYNNKVAFTDSKGLPYETMTFRALKSETISLTIFRNITIEADAVILQSTPASGTLRLIESTTAFAGPVSKKTYAATSSTTPANNRIDVFSGSETFNLAMTEGKLYTFFYIADEKSYDDIIVTEGSGCYIDISNIVDSAYQNAKLEAFTYEWLIEQLLLKIDSTATLVSTVAYPNVKELLSCTPCIINLGKTNGTGKIKTALKDVLESFNKLKCIAIDITGSVMTISNRLKVGSVESKVYPTDSSYGLITVNNIVVEHSTEHQYNKIMVGADTEDRQDDDPLIYPFICEKEFSVEETIAENTLDLVNNFMLDPYDIDRYIMKTLGETDVKDECKFVVFACSGAAGIYSTLQNGESIDAVGYNYEFPENINIVTLGTESRLNRIPVFSNTSLIINRSSSKLFSFVCSEPGTYQMLIQMRISTQHGLDDITFMYADIDQHGFSVIEASATSLGGSISSFYIIVSGHLSVGETYSPEIVIRVLQDFQGLDILETDIFIESKNSIYRGHDKPITGFRGDSDTIYNIPLTPKRILNNWINYLAISVVGKTTKELKYGTATILNSAITSKCDYEAASVVENADLSLTDVTPLFLPATISADTSEQILDINTFEDDDKYKYFSLKDEKTNKTYQGWINSVTFALAKNKSKQIMLQAKSI